MVDFAELAARRTPSGARRELWIYTGRMFQINPFVAQTVGVAPVDTTTRGQHPLWAPGWDIVMGHKAWVNAGRPMPKNNPLLKQVTDEEYTAVYLDRMRNSYETKTDEWLRVLNDQYTTEQGLVLCCFCKPGDFCHRHILADILLKTSAHHGIPARLMGEWQ